MFCLGNLLEDHIYIADFVVKDITSYGGQYGAWNIQSDHIEFNRVRFENNHACDTCPGGALRMELTRSSKMQNMEFIGNSAGNGGAGSTGDAGGSRNTGARIRRHLHHQDSQ